MYDVTHVKQKAIFFEKNVAQVAFQSILSTLFVMIIVYYFGDQNRGQLLIYNNSQYDKFTM